jgi:hypothetical protein
MIKADDGSSTVINTRRCAGAGGVQSNAPIDNVARTAKALAVEPSKLLIDG